MQPTTWEALWSGADGTLDIAGDPVHVLAWNAVSEGGGCAAYDDLSPPMLNPHQVSCTVLVAGELDIDLTERRNVRARLTHETGASLVFAGFLTHIDVYGGDRTYVRVQSDGPVTIEEAS